MVKFKPWQWVVLGLPIAMTIGFLLIAAGMQIHTWQINWIWGVFTLLLVGWRWLLVKWTQPVIDQMGSTLADVRAELATAATQPVDNLQNKTSELVAIALQSILTQAQTDRPIWEDWQTFWQRCQDLIVAVAKIYHPEVKYPLLNIYVTQAYGLIRGTSDDMDVWMQKLAPALDQVTISQTYEAYETYKKLQPSAQKLLKVWNWAQWVINPTKAIAKLATKESAGVADRQ